MEALGLKDKYVIKVNSRKILDGVMDEIGLSDDAHSLTRLAILRAVDKIDRLGREGAFQLLTTGRADASGDVTKGAGLSEQHAHTILFHTSKRGIPMNASDEFIAMYGKNAPFIQFYAEQLPHSDVFRLGHKELEGVAKLIAAAGYDDRIAIDPSVVRGLEYYTGPVFEAEITIPVVNEDGQTVRFGSVGGGGRYDGLVERFLGTKVPATGFSIGVSRLQAALAAINKDKPAASDGPVVVLVMEKDRLADYQRMAQSLRQAGIRAEMYLGTAGMKAQMKYADRRGAPCVVIQGGDERAKGEVQIKDLIEGAKAAATIKDSKEWREGRPAQISVPEASLVAAVRDLLARHRA
jgi:histidyl-tRNA synthetase